jgi:deazaflavin-dependent oxidoreductase (nitroreductase family)
MLVRILQVVIGVAAVSGVLWLGFAVSFRTKFRPVQNAIRRMNRRILNPRQLRTAGQPGAWTSVVHHVGRTSGTSYQTPVVAVPTTDRFVIALPYGSSADWVRNVLAAGTASITHEGLTIRVTGPELMPADDANRLFAAKEQRMHRLYGVDDFLVLTRAAQLAGPLCDQAVSASSAASPTMRGCLQARGHDVRRDGGRV